MLGKSSKNIIMGNIQLINYCANHSISLAKLSDCNIEKMGNTYFFVLGRGIKSVSMDNDIDTQPDVVLTMDVSSGDFIFNNTQWTSRVI